MEKHAKDTVKICAWNMLVLPSPQPVTVPGSGICFVAGTRLAVDVSR